MGKTDISQLRSRISRIEQRHERPFASVYLGTGFDQVDEALEGGLRRGALHEFAGAGYDRQLCARPTRFVARILGQHTGPVVWIGQGEKTLHLAGLQAEGLTSRRLLYIEAQPGHIPAVMEDILRTAGLCAVVADLQEPLSLIQSRRLQLAAEISGGTGILLHRHDRILTPTACWTRWRIAGLSTIPTIIGSTPVLAHEAAWSLSLLRRRGGEALSWTVGGQDGPSSSFDMDAGMAHHVMAESTPRNRSVTSYGAVWA